MCVCMRNAYEWGNDGKPWGLCILKEDENSGIVGVGFRLVIR